MPEPTHPLAQLEYTTRIAKRAQYEAFEFSIVPTGVLVRNCSHEDPAEHEYVVTVRGNLPVACECPADEKYDGACKHRVAVAVRRPVLSAATAFPLPDGGEVETRSEESSLATVADEPDDCECATLTSSFPCWDCVRTGRKQMPD